MYYIDTQSFTRLCLLVSVDVICPRSEIGETTDSAKVDEATMLRVDAVADTSV